jgi:hypothetical protein
MRERERERERDLNNKPGFPFRKGTLLSSSWKSASNPAKVSSDLLCFWLPLPLPLYLANYYANGAHSSALHVWMVGLCGLWVLGTTTTQEWKKIIFYNIYIKNSLLLATWVVAHLKQILTDFTQKFPPSPSLKDHTSLYNNNGEMQEALLGIAD